MSGLRAALIVLGGLAILGAVALAASLPGDGSADDDEMSPEEVDAWVANAVDDLTSRDQLRESACPEPDGQRTTCPVKRITRHVRACIIDTPNATGRSHCRNPEILQERFRNEDNCTGAYDTPDCVRIMDRFNDCETEWTGLGRPPYSCMERAHTEREAELHSPESDL